MKKIPFETIEDYLDNKDTFRNPAFREKAYQEALRELKIDQIKIDEFADLYDVEKDKKRVAQIEKRFAEENSEKEKENKELATVLEAILYEEIYLNCYLGEDTETYSASKFDDYVNGVDIIVEVSEENRERLSHLALAVDATFSRDVLGKINKVKSKIKSGQLAIIKYFKSEALNFRGEKSGIPEFVIGIDKKSLEEVTFFWLQNRHQKLNCHYLHLMIIDEILSQAQYYQNYAQEQGQEKIAHRYQHLFELFQKIKNGKKEIIEKTLEAPGNKERMDEDSVYQSIMNLTKKRK
jgi:hypothetical protein